MNNLKNISSESGFRDEAGPSSIIDQKDKLHLQNERKFSRPKGYAYYDKTDRVIKINPKPPTHFAWIHERDPVKRMELYMNYSRSAKRNGTLLPVSTFPSGITKVKDNDHTTQLEHLQLLFSEAIKSLPPSGTPNINKKSISDILADYAEDIVPITEEKNGIKTLYNGRELLSMDTSMDVPLIDPIVPKNEISFLAGKGDTGKSLFCTEMILCIVLGVPELAGMKVSPTYNSALYLSAEDNIRRVSNRVKKQVSKYNDITSVEEKMENLFIRTIKEDLFRFLDSFLEKRRVDIIILDPFGEVVEGDENSQKDVRNYLNKIELIIKKYECSVLFIAHVNKSGKDNANRDKIMGSTAIADRARSVLMMNKDSNSSEVRLSIVKANNLSEEEKKKKIKMRLDNNTLTFMRTSDFNPGNIVNADSPSPCVINFNVGFNRTHLWVKTVTT